MIFDFVITGSLLAALARALLGAGQRPSAGSSYDRACYRNTIEIRGGFEIAREAVRRGLIETTRCTLASCQPSVDVFTRGDPSIASLPWTRDVRWWDVPVTVSVRFSAIAGGVAAEVVWTAPPDMLFDETCKSWFHQTAKAEFDGLVEIIDQAMRFGGGRPPAAPLPGASGSYSAGTGSMQQYLSGITPGHPAIYQPPVAGVQPSPLPLASRMPAPSRRQVPSPAWTVGSGTFSLDGLGGWNVSARNCDNWFYCDRTVAMRRGVFSSAELVVSISVACVRLDDPPDQLETGMADWSWRRAFLVDVASGIFDVPSLERYGRGLYLDAPAISGGRMPFGGARFLKVDGTVGVASSCYEWSGRTDQNIAMSEHLDVARPPFVHRFAFSVMNPPASFRKVWPGTTIGEVMKQNRCVFDGLINSVSWQV